MRKLRLVVEYQRQHMGRWLTVSLSKRQRTSPHRVLRQATLAQHINLKTTLVLNTRILGVRVRVDQVAELQDTHKGRLVGASRLLAHPATRLATGSRTRVIQEVQATSTS